jgi:replicative DNA helicase
MSLGARDKVPNLADPETLNRLADLIVAHGIEVLAIDPIYLALGSTKNGSVNHNDMFVMGNLLFGFSSTVQAAGATPILTHHFVKPRARNANRIPELSDLAHAGIGQFARQWLLVDRRARFDPNESLHKLHLVTGGYGHSSYHMIDIDMSQRHDGLSQWDVKVKDDPPPTSPDSVTGKQDQGKPRGPSLDAAHSELLTALASLGGKATARKIRDTTHWSKNKVDRVTEEMINEGRLRRVGLTVACGNEKTRACEGFEAVREPVSESPVG